VLTKQSPPLGRRVDEEPKMAQQSKKTRARTGPVTAAAVIDAALAVIDEEGLGALTMRRLAHDLGVEPVTIYRQLPNKDAILAGVAERLWGEMGPPEGVDTEAGGAAGGGAAGAVPAAPPDWREQVRGMWLALNGLMQAHPNAIPIIARGGSYSASAGEGTAGMLSLFKDAGLSPQEAAELLHILSACVVGFGFATLWGRQAAAARQAATAAGEPAPEPPDLGDLSEYVAATARWDPAQFATAVDIVLDAYGDGAAR
jgi:TetR/AcrR family transcriptional regulator, tetracycline repressor protein